MPAAFGVAALISAPYLLLDSSNYFHKDGFVDKIGTFASVLTGFYVAGLVAVATFPRNEAGLDKTIEFGKIILPSANRENDEYMTRREYVCAMFGYLAFASLIITTTSIIAVTTSDWMNGFSDQTLLFAGQRITFSKICLRSVAVAGCSIILGHVFATTVRGLYYLIDRIYAVAPSPLARKDD